MNFTKFLNRIQRKGHQLDVTELRLELENLDLNLKEIKYLFVKGQDKFVKNLISNTEYYTVEGFTIPPMSSSCVMEFDISSACLLSVNQEVFFIQHLKNNFNPGFATARKAIYQTSPAKTFSLNNQLGPLSIWNKSDKEAFVLLVKIKNEPGKSEISSHREDYDAINQIII